MSSRATYSCIRCADRKVKCDRQRPCNNCAKRNLECIFNANPPARKRHKRTKEQALNDKLKYYEELLQAQGVDIAQLPDGPHFSPSSIPDHIESNHSTNGQMPTPPSATSDLDRCISKSQILQSDGRTQFVDNSLWTRVVEEFQDPEDAVEDSSHDASDLEASDDDFDYVLSRRTKATRSPRHPPSHVVQDLWQIYLDNVDPLTRIVHVSTLSVAIRKAKENLNRIPRGFEALLFGIYSTAIMSSTDDDCKQKFGEPRKDLLRRYVAATKLALSRANFMATINLVVLQALLLHLFSVRDVCEPRAVYSLTGIAVRIAQCMGLDRDGTSLGLSPFESEIRRRVWWSLKTHEFRTAELCGMAKFRDIDIGPEATKWPTNVNDHELFPEMTVAPVETGSMTDFVFNALRYELTKLAAGRVARFREQGKSHSQWDLRASGPDKDEIQTACKEVEERLETRYLRYCDPSQPLHLLTMVLARSAMNNILFLTNHPRKWASVEQAPPEEQQLIWNVSVKHLEQQDMIQSNPQLRPYAWHSAYFLQWHSFIHVLDSLRARPFIHDAEKAWRLVGRTYRNNPELISDTRRPIHIAVGNLCLKAYTARENAFRNAGSDLSAVPEYISQLRQQRAAAKAKRDTKTAERDQSEGVRRMAQVNLSNAANTDSAQNTGIPDASTPLRMQYTQDTNVHAQESFWLLNGFNDSQLGNFEDIMNIDPDFMLSPQPSTGESVAEPISWAQWDTWLAESNIIPPLQQM